MRENINHWKHKNLDLSAPILYKEPASLYAGLYKQEEQDHGIGRCDWKLLKAAKPALDGRQKVFEEFSVRNTDRTIGTILSNEVTKKYECDRGLPDDSIHFKFNGTAGQSFGAFNTKGVTFELEGDANDYFGKGLSGARLIFIPAGKQVLFRKKISLSVMFHFTGPLPARHISGVKQASVLGCAIRGNAVVEGVGDHGCEYMTGGTVVVSADTGSKFCRRNERGYRLCI